jgi:hypothetical protein
LQISISHAQKKIIFKFNRIYKNWIFKTNFKQLENQKSKIVNLQSAISNQIYSQTAKNKKSAIVNHHS